MTENEVFLLDTNILVYAYDAADIQKHTISKKIINKCLDGEYQIAISPQNLSEFFSVTTSKGLLEKTDAIKVISDIIVFPGWIKIGFDHITVLAAAKISDEYKMSYWDSLLVDTMKQNGVLKIYTENTKDFKVPWLVVENPFS
ncbi:MAG: PIN domain-containing protein [Candidatus Aenigmarchaeota archaeon]|nr:PIN domain-containing protein [Candidatus Aenigmarchaeota archaeon]